jgi:vancomycin resistance protein YoaR
MTAEPLNLADGADRHPIAPEAIAAAITFGPVGDEPYGVRLNQSVLAGAVAQLRETIHREPIDAAFTFDASGPNGVVPASPGRDLNVDATVLAVLDGLRARGDGIEVPPVALSASFVDPALTTAAAQAILPDLVRLSTWTTWYQPGSGNGWGANISIPARDLDLMVILPGETFDFWRDIGPVTVERGYTYGGAIIGGRSVAGKALAGGICSTSTTLFNTALRAGLQMGARLNHYYYIPRYPVGLDATVYATDHWAQTMSFTNDTDGPLIIRAFTGRGMVRFDLWGLPLNRTVTFSTPVITNRRTAADTIEYTGTLPAGTTQRVEYPHHGFDVTVTRTVRDRSTGEVIWTNTYTSSYRAVNGVTLVGTG